MLRKWIRKEPEYRDWKQGQRRATKGRQPELPELELALREKFVKIREKGYKVKRPWFIAQARKLVTEIYPGNTLVADFQFSKGWFRRFKKRQRIAYRTPTNKAQEIPAHYVLSIQKFHIYLRKLAIGSLTLYSIPTGLVNELPVLGVFRLCDIANVDQTPCSFDFLTGKTYNIQGEKTVWVKSTGSGLDKRQMTVQLTIFADGIARVKPLVVFRGKGLRITAAEKMLWDNRVQVVFQENAWVDEDIFIWWIQHAWKMCRSSVFDTSQKLITLDMHRAQNTEKVKDTFKHARTTPAIIPGGCTSLIQPLDVSINKSFKQYLEDASQEHFFENTDSWMEGKVSAKERRILMAKWVGDAWDKIAQNHIDSVKRSFAKCGIALPQDGTRDSEINIEGLPNYQVPGAPVMEPESQPTKGQNQWIAWNGNGEFDAEDTSSSDVESSSSWYEDAEVLELGEYVLDM